MVEEVYEKVEDKNAYYRCSNGRLKYNKICMDCEKECKQSFRTQIYYCPEKMGGEKVKKRGRRKKEKDTSRDW